MSLLKEALLIKVRPSIWLISGLFGIYAGAGLSVMCLAIPWLWKIMAGVMLSGLAIQAIRQQLHIAQHPLNHSMLNYEQVTLSSGEIGTVSPQSLSHRLFIILKVVTVEQRRYQLVILPDAMPAEVFRQLRIRLKYRYCYHPQDF